MTHRMFLDAKVRGTNTALPQGNAELLELLEVTSGEQWVLQDILLRGIAEQGSEVWFDLYILKPGGTDRITTYAVGGSTDLLQKESEIHDAAPFTPHISTSSSPATFYSRYTVLEAGTKVKAAIVNKAASAVDVTKHGCGVRISGQYFVV